MFVGPGFHLGGPLCLGFHLNVPLSRWTGKGVGGVGGVLEAPTLGSIGFRFSRVPPPTFSAAHTDRGAAVSLHTWPHEKPTAGNREKETGEFSGVPFGFQALGYGVAAVR